MKVKLSIFLTLLMISTPLVAAAPALAEFNEIIPISVGKESNKMMTNGDTFDISDVDYHGVCTAKTSWIISSNIVCTASTFTVTNYVTINSGGSLTLEQNSVMSISVPVSSWPWSYKVDVRGKLFVMNSTIKAANANEYYGVYAYMAQHVRLEGATIQNYYYYGIYGYSASKIQINNSVINGQGSYTWSYGVYAGMATGYIMNSTISRGRYAIYLNNIWNMDVLNNTLTNAAYGANLYSYNGNFYDNTLKSNSQYGVQLYNSRPMFANNVIQSNSQAGIYFYNGGDSIIRNCTITNNGQRDLWLESTSAKVINTEFGKAALDINGWGGGNSKLQVYWYANVSVKWLSDDSPVADAEVTIEDVLGNPHEIDLYTDSNGEVLWVPLMEYQQVKAGKTDMTPHWINSTAEFEGRDIMNFSQVSISKAGPNVADLRLDDVPPPLVIFSPEDDFLTNQTNVTIEGATENFVDPDRPVIVQIRLKGITYEPEVDSAGGFSQLVNLPMDGNHDFDISAFDWVMNKVETTLRVRRDTKNPGLEILEPVNELLTNNPKVTVSGTTEAGTVLTVNEVEVEVDVDGLWTTVVDLVEGDNIITVKTIDPAQNWVQLEKEVTLDTIPPALIVSEPIDGLKTNDRNLRVAGLTEQYGRVTMNGLPVLVAGASFQTNYQLTEGENTLVIDGIDAAGNHNITTRTVFLDTIPPTLTVTEPAVNNLLVNTDTITVAGYVDPGSKLLINRYDVGMDGDWTYEVELREGKNKITVEAIDDVGNKITVGRTVIRDTTPPLLAVFSPENERTFSEDQILVEGSVEPGANLTINGDPVGSVGGVFTHAYILTEGENTITLKAKDVAGNSKTEILKVNLDTIVNLEVDMSKNGKTVQKANLTIRGETDVGAVVHVDARPVEVRADGKFTYEVSLLEGNNTILIQAHDEYGNEDHIEMNVILKTPGGGIGSVGTDIGNSNNWWIWLIVVVVMISCISVIVANNIVSKRKAREAEMQIEADQQAAALKSDGPHTIYDQLYGPQPTEMAADQYTPSPTAMIAPPPPVSSTQDIPTGTAINQESQYNITEGAQMKVDEAANRIKRYQAEGKDTLSAERNIRLAKQFAARGNSEKAEGYADKALELLTDDV